MPASIHPLAKVCPTARIGNATRVGAGAIVDDAVWIGRHAMIGSGARIRANAEIGDGCYIAGGTDVGEGCRLARGCETLAGSSNGPRLGAGTLVGEGARVGARTTTGANAIIGARATIGEDCTIAAGAQVAGGSRLPDRTRAPGGESTGKPERPDIDPTADIAESAVICAGTRVGAKAQIGEDALVMGECRIGARTRIGARAILRPTTTVGADAAIGADVRILSEVGHDSYVRDGARLGACTVIGRGVSIGANAKIGDHCRIRAEVSIGEEQRIASHTELRPTSGAGNEHRIRIGELLRHPGPRYRNQGPESGEGLREEWLAPALESARAAGNPLVVDLAGTEYGYPVAFLEEALGGLVRAAGPETVRAHLRIADDEHRSMALACELIDAALTTADLGAVGRGDTPEDNPLETGALRVRVGDVLAYAQKQLETWQRPHQGAEGSQLSETLETARRRLPGWNWTGNLDDGYLIRADALSAHARRRASASGYDPDGWPGRHIDWAAAGRELTADMASFRWKGIQWWLQEETAAEGTATD